MRRLHAAKKQSMNNCFSLLALWVSRKRCFGIIHSMEKWRMYETNHWRNIDSGCTILTLPFVIKSVDTKLREKSAGRKYGKKVREESAGRYMVFNHLTLQTCLMWKKEGFKSYEKNCAKKVILKIMVWLREKDIKKIHDWLRFKDIIILSVY